MLAALRRFFDERIAPAEDPEHALHLATAMVLLEVSRADFAVGEEELATVAAVLRERFGLQGAELEELMALGVERSDQSHSLHPFVRLLNERFTPEQRARVVEDLWRVAYADGRLDKYEEYHIRRIADLLYVPHAAFIRAKLRVQEGTA